MSDRERALTDELNGVKAERDRYASLCGTAFQPDGAVRQGLEGAAAAADVDTMRAEVRNVINFLASNNPFA